MQKAVYVSWEDVPGILSDYFGVPPEDVKVTEGGITVIVERKAADETDRA